MLKVFDNKIFVCGIDEAGRGCLAGPVTAAAVVLPKKYKNPFIKDSKKLNKSDRLDLYNEIIECSLDYAIIDISPKIIDSINILESTFLAMNNAISKIHNIIDYTIIDGNKFKTEKKIKYKCIVKGDNIYQSIAAASILAKVHRDKIMEDLHLNFPEYDWINNKGYGTSKHRLAIRNYGITKHHRKSFNLIEKQLKIKI
jgi:ribonuclease HII